jgi:ribonucleoside-diphosphate reductase alpha chain
LAYTRHVRDGDREIDLRYVSPRFEAALKNADIKKDKRERILSKVTQSGSCQNIEDVPEAIQDVFVVSGDIPAEGHIRMQAALQIFTDASISKTVNFPVDAEPEDVAEAFLLAWHLGCKGLTVYVAGSRQEEVLETEETRRKKDDEVKQGSDRDLAMRSEQPPMDPHVTPRRPRPNSLQGTTYRSQTPLGTAYVTINTNGDNQPFEVFLNVGKAGSDTAAVAEAMGRLISLVLRLPSPVEPKERLTQIVDQLSGIGGRRPSGFGHNRVLSLPDGVAGVLESYLHPDDEPVSELTLSLGPHTEEHDATQPNLALFQVGDLCPECGQATLINTEGCRRCYACGHSEC